MSIKNKPLFTNGQQVTATDLNAIPEWTDQAKANIELNNVNLTDSGETTETCLYFDDTNKIVKIGKILSETSANKDLSNINDLPQVPTTQKAMFKDTDGKIKEGLINDIETVHFKTNQKVNDVSISNLANKLTPDANTLLATDLYSADIQEINDEINIKANKLDVDSELLLKQNKLVEGTNITIDQTTNTISASGGTGTINWGGINGTLNNQTDLNIALNAKANGNEVVKLTGDQTITGNKKIEKVTTNEIYYDGNGAIKPLTFINNTQLAGYVDFIQPYKTGFKNYTGFRMLRDENGLLILGASILIDNRNALRIISQIDDIWVMNTLSMQGNRIINLGLPTSDTDASNKKYVDDSLANKANKSLDNIDELPQATTTTKTMFRDTDGKIKEAPIITDAKFKNNTTLNTIDYDAAQASSTNIWSSFRTNIKFDAKADSNSVVKITDNQDISGIKNFKDATSFEKAVNVYTNPDKTNGLFIDTLNGIGRIAWKIDNEPLKTIELLNNTFIFNNPITVSNNDNMVSIDSGSITFQNDGNLVVLQSFKDVLNKLRLRNINNGELFAYISDIPLGAIKLVQRYPASSLNWVASPRTAPIPQVRKLSQIINATLWADILANSTNYIFVFWPNAQKGSAPYTNNKPFFCTLKGSGNYLFSTTWETYNIVGNNIGDKFRYELYLETNRTDGTLYFVYDKVSGNDFPNDITMLYFDIWKL